MTSANRRISYSANHPRAARMTPSLCNKKEGCAEAQTFFIFLLYPFCFFHFRTKARKVKSFLLLL